MKKLAKKVLAICLSAVMAGSLLSAVAFATKSETVSDEEYEIATLASATVISKSTTKTDWSYSGDVYIEKGVTLTLSGTCTISGNVYVFGTIMNRGILTVTGTLHCLNYFNGIFTGRAGNYNYGYFYDYGTLYFHGLDVTPGWLEDTEIPETTDDGDDGDNNNDDGDSGDDSGTETSSGTHVTVIDGEETFTDQEITGDVVIPEDTTLTTSGDVSINGNVYVLGTLINTGTLNITGTLYCLHYGSMLSAGDYDFGYVYNYDNLNAVGLIATDDYLSIDFPTSTVHVWGEIEWTWSDDHSSATASRTCEICDFKETLDATVTSETTDPTETEDGSIVYTATVTLEDGSELTTTYDEIIPATGQEDSNSSGSGSSNSGSSNSGSSNSGSSNSGSSNGGSSSSGSSGSDSSSSGSSSSSSSGSDSSSSDSSGSGSSGSGYSGSGSSGSGSSSNGSSGSGSSGSSGSSTYSPQTDDPTNTTALWLIVAGFGLAGCAVLVLYKVRGFKVRN